MKDIFLTNVFQVEDDIPVCKTVHVEMCKDETVGYTTNKVCEDWPHEECEINKEKVTKQGQPSALLYAEKATNWEKMKSQEEEPVDKPKVTVETIMKMLPILLKVLRVLPMLKSKMVICTSLVHCPI